MKSQRNRFEEKNAVPLLPEETALLRDIYNNRKQLLLSVYCVVIPLAVFCSFKVDYRTRHTGQLVKWESAPGEDRAYMSRLQMILINNLFLTFPLSLIGTIIYRRRVGYLQKDILSGVKYAVYEEVAFKQYFPATRQYYLGLNDVGYLHHEVDEMTYNSVQEGDLFPIYFARYSQYAFNKNGSFQLL